MSISKDGSLSLKKTVHDLHFQNLHQKKKTDLLTGASDEKGKVVCHWRMANAYKCVLSAGHYKNRSDVKSQTCQKIKYCSISFETEKIKCKQDRLLHISDTKSFFKYFFLKA